MTYNYYGCYNDPSLNALPISAGLAAPVSISDCSAAAISNNSLIFGLKKEGNFNRCFLSSSALTPEEQLTQAIQAGPYDGSGNDYTKYPICKNKIGSLDGPSTSVFVNERAISFFDDQQIGTNIGQKIIYYQAKLNGLNSRFNKLINDISNMLIDLGLIANPPGLLDHDKIILKSSFNELSLIMKQYLTIQLGLELTCNSINEDIINLNKRIHILDEDNFVAQNRMTGLYGTDNAAMGLASDNNSISNIKITENIMFIVSVVIFARIIFYLE